MKNKVQLITYADRLQLITYADRLGDGNLASLTDILRTRFDGVYEGVHILPFFTPFDGADAGFDPIDHTKVDPRLGDWDDVAELAKTHDIMVDAIVNHMSWQSRQFQDVLKRGEESEYYPMFLTMIDPIDHTKVDPRLGDWDDVAELAKTHDIMVDAIFNHMSRKSRQLQDVLNHCERSEYYPMFLTMSSVFPDGAPEEELAGSYRPRPGMPFTHYSFAGKTRLVWVTFTPQQVDIDTDSADGWAYLMSIFDRKGTANVKYLLRVWCGPRSRRSWWTSTPTPPKAGRI